MFLTMIFTDVTKIFFGRLRPNFLEECNANRTICGGSDALYDEDICLEQDDDVLREARYGILELTMKLRIMLLNNVLTLLELDYMVVQEAVKFMHL